MAGASLLAVIDDITAVLDDIATMSKVAAKKASGVLGDDIALGAQQSQQKVSVRELPVVWAIFKGSLINKLILIPIALIIAVVAPVLINFALFLGGVYLCLEGFEKVHEHFSAKHPTDSIKETGTGTEEDKVKGAIKTDMILSLEVIVLTLGMVATAPLYTKIGTLFAIGFAMSIFVYSLIALIIRMDDRGLSMIKHSKENSLKQKAGFLLVTSAPKVMQTIGIVGTVAMFSVGGGILLHLGHIELETIKSFVGINFGVLEHVWGVNGLAELLIQLTLGLILGFITYLIVETAHHLFEKK